MGTGKTHRRILATMLAAFLLAACGEGTEPDDDAATDERVTALEADLEEERSRVEELEEENAQLRDEIAELRDEVEREPTSEPDGGQPTGRPQDLRSPEGLVDQLRLLFEDDDSPEEWEQETTDWEPFELPDGMDNRYDEPGLIAADLLRLLDGPALGLDVWESTTRVYLDPVDEDIAYVAVLSWGFADDSVVGRDVRVTVTRAADGWEPGGAEVRQHCRRGAANGACV